MDDVLGEALRQGGFAACAALLFVAVVHLRRENLLLRAEIAKLVSDHSSRVDKLNEARISEAMKSVEALAVNRELVEVVGESVVEKRGRR